jgi:hypothetical protein
VYKRQGEVFTYSDRNDEYQQACIDFVTYFFKSLDINPDLVVLNATRPGKFSLHIIANNVFIKKSDLIQMFKYKELDPVLEYWPEFQKNELVDKTLDVPMLYDRSIYSNIRCFRMANQTKLDSSCPPLRIVSKHSFKDSLITHVTEEQLANGYLTEKFMDLTKMRSLTKRSDEFTTYFDLSAVTDTQLKNMGEFIIEASRQQLLDQFIDGDYKDWIEKFMFAIKNSFQKNSEYGFYVFNLCSSFSSYKYEGEEKTRYQWENKDARPNGFNFDSIVYWCKFTNPQLTAKLLRQFEFQPLTYGLLDGTPYFPTPTSTENFENYEATTDEDTMSVITSSSFLDCLNESSSTHTTPLLSSSSKTESSFLPKLTQETEVKLTKKELEECNKFANSQQTEKDFAEFFHALYYKDFIFQDDAWYKCIKGFWKQEDRMVNNHIQEIMGPRFLPYFLSQRTAKIEEYSKQKQFFEKQIEEKVTEGFKISKIQKKSNVNRQLENSSGKEMEKWKDAVDNFLKYSHSKSGLNDIREMLENKYISHNRVEFDMIPNLFVFSDAKCFDFSKNQFIELKPEYYVSMHCGWKYDDKYEYNPELDVLIEQIFPDVECREFTLNHLSTGMIGKRFPYFHILNGSGRNGKGVIVNLLISMLGQDDENYACQLSDSVYGTKEIGNGGPDVEIANMHMKRFVNSSEPKATIPLNTANVKKLTGEDHINARKLYSNNNKVTLHATIGYQANTIQNLDHCNDPAVKSRVLIHDFPSRFLDQHEIDELPIDKRTNIYPKNEKYTLVTWRNQMRQSLFLKLKDYAVRIVSNDYLLPSPPSSALLRLNEYINNSDDFGCWFKDTYEFTPQIIGSHVKLKDIADNFKESQIFKSFDNTKKKDFTTNSKFIKFIQSNNELKQHLVLENGPRCPMLINGKLINSKQPNYSILYNWSAKNDIEDEIEDCPPVEPTLSTSPFDISPPNPPQFGIVSIPFGKRKNDQIVSFENIDKIQRK